jgi:hypothetical protein
MVNFLLVQPKIDNVKEACISLVAENALIVNKKLYYKPICWIAVNSCFANSSFPPGE